MMIRLLVIACWFGAMLGTARSMNWEGHEDWMIDLPAAGQLKSIEGKPIRPPVPPAKRKTCMGREKIGKVQLNPYENILPLCPERGRLKKK
jgi:hypothetical protein